MTNQGRFYDLKRRVFGYNVCPHRWCPRSITYDHRCKAHQDDPDELPTKVVGWGPFPMPGERARLRRAEAKARRMLALAEEASHRHQDNE